MNDEPFDDRAIAVGEADWSRSPYHERSHQVSPTVGGILPQSLSYQRVKILLLGLNQPAPIAALLSQLMHQAK